MWRAADQDGEVFDIPVQPRRNQGTAKRFCILSLIGFLKFLHL